MNFSEPVSHVTAATIARLQKDVLGHCPGELKASLTEYATNNFHVTFFPIKRNNNNFLRKIILMSIN